VLPVSCYGSFAGGSLSGGKAKPCTSTECPPEQLSGSFSKCDKTVLMKILLSLFLMRHIVLSSKHQTFGFSATSKHLLQLVFDDDELLEASSSF
jgi:hypothetical protein